MKSKTKIFRFITKLLPETIHFNLEFLIKTGYLPNLVTPSTFNEKIQFRKKFWKNPLFIVGCDKYKVRKYVQDKVGEKILIPLLYKGKKIEFKELRNIVAIEKKVVIKINNDSGSVFFADNLMTDNKLQRLCTRINSQISNNFGTRVDEKWYSKVEPLIIVEKNISHNGDLPDYKLHVFKRNAEEFDFIFHIDFGRFTKDRGRTFYDSEYNIMDIKQRAFKVIKKEFPLNKNIGNEMKAIATKLAQDFSYVRVDLYYSDNKIYFGELTFAPGSGFTGFACKEQDEEFGSRWICSAEY